MQHQVELFKWRAGEGNYNQMPVWMLFLKKYFPVSSQDNQRPLPAE